VKNENLQICGTNNTTVLRFRRDPYTDLSTGALSPLYPNCACAPPAVRPQGFPLTAPVGVWA